MNAVDDNPLLANAGDIKTYGFYLLADPTPCDNPVFVVTEVQNGKEIDNSGRIVGGESSRTNRQPVRAARVNIMIASLVRTYVALAPEAASTATALKMIAVSVESLERDDGTTNRQRFAANDPARIGSAMSCVYQLRNSPGSRRRCMIGIMIVK